jgi:hypothetical protein
MKWLASRQCDNNAATLNEIVNDYFLHILKKNHRYRVNNFNLSVFNVELEKASELKIPSSSSIELMKSLSTDSLANVQSILYCHQQT